VVLYSGGRDSTCLLDLAVTIAGRGAVRALHVNYGLRDDADADERHCAECCERLGVAFSVSRPRRPERPLAPAAKPVAGKPVAGNLQAWARDARYGAAAGLALARGGDVAAGHTATDQAETILYRLASSPSRRALLGMRPREGLLVRPLLTFTREQTAEHCERRGLGWREDDSNESGVFARNRIRSGLLPALVAIHPGAQANVLALADLLRDESEVLDALVDEVLAEAKEIELLRLRELPHAVSRLVVQRLADEAAGGLAPGAGRRAHEVLALRTRGTAALDLGNGVRALAEYGRLRFESRDIVSEPAFVPAPVSLRIPGAVQFGEQEVRCELGQPAHPQPAHPDDARAGHARQRERERRWEEAGVLDRDALGTELIVRSWRSGDRMAPLGLGGSKSLQDLFSARRVPRRERGGVPVVQSGQEIVWVAGVAISDRFKVTAATRQTARLTVSARRRPKPDRAAAASPSDEAHAAREKIARQRDIKYSAVTDEDAIGDILVPAEDLARRVHELAAEISSDYAGKDLVLIGVLKGAVFFLSDLMRDLAIPCEVDFMAVASYGSATKSSGVVRILKDLDAVIEGRDVLIVEDIVDSGLTLQYLLRNLGARDPRSLEVCALLIKPERRKVDLHTRYVGFEIPDRFAIGYGLDHAERYRNLPYVAALRE